MRREDWPERLADAIEHGRTTPFAWGACDCCLFAADVVLAMTGTDYGKDFRGRYKTAAGASRVLKRIGEGAIEATMDGMLPRRPHPMRGDFVLVHSDAGPTLGICLGILSAFKAPDGITMLPTANAFAAWAVD